MRALTLRLRGPLQSWGGPVAGDNRPTQDFPTQTGVLGLVGGALGIRRADVAGMARLHSVLAVSVRVDAAGTQGLDYHTVQQVPARGGGRQDTKNLVTRRSYLYDACFTALVVPVGDASAISLEEMADALNRPRFAPCLGRRSCPPSVPVLLGLYDGDSELALLRDIPVAQELTLRNSTHWDLFLHGDHPKVEGRVRPLKIRDRLLPGGPRMMGERWVTHVRLERPVTAPAAAAKVKDWFGESL